MILLQIDNVVVVLAGVVLVAAIVLFLCYVNPPVGTSSLKQSFKFISYIKPLSILLALTSLAFAFLFMLSLSSNTMLKSMLKS